jgi:transaldolase
MTKLRRLHDEQGQSPWLDNLTRDHLRSGHLRELVHRGVRGVTANPTILANAIAGSDAYDDQFAKLVGGGATVEEAYWELVIADVGEALELLAPLHETSNGGDGFVSLEVAPALAHDADASAAAAADLHRRIERPNLLVKIPATSEGIDAIRQATAAGHSINVTLRRRARPCPTPRMSTSSSAPTASTRYPSRRSRRSRTTARWPGPSTRTPTAPPRS